MTERSEYKFRLTVSMSQKVNLGNYENIDIFESLSMGFDEEDQLPDVRDTLKREVEQSVAFRASKYRLEKTEKEKEPPKYKTFGDDIPKSEIESGETWPESMICYKCGKEVPRRESKFPDTPYYYRCECGAKMWPQWFQEKMGWKK